MTPLAIHARHYATRTPVTIRCEGGVITAIEPATMHVGENVWVAPGLVDVQVNGYAGVDFQRDELTEGQLLKAARTLRADGCTRFFLTLITDEWRALTNRLRVLKALRDASPELRASIAGWHVEGPFMSDQPGFCGAHNPAFMRDPTPENIRELRAITGDDPLLITVAPERRGVVDAIRLAVSLGIRVSLGHTNAPAEILAAAVAAGATGFTHLGNGCTKELDRHDNILWRVFDTPGLTVGLIPDKIHVSPLLFRLVHRVLPAERIYYTTDAMSAAGAPPGRYTIGALELEVGADQIVRQPGKTNFAGSALRAFEGIFRAAQMLGRPWQEVWDHGARAAAGLVGLSAELAPGARADFCVLRFKPGADLPDIEAYLNGARTA
jgi:N-acetylglucosamine-6-phosphate deacetylase